MNKIYETHATQTTDKKNKEMREFEKDCLNNPKIKSVEEELTYKEHKEARSKDTVKGGNDE